MSNNLRKYGVVMFAGFQLCGLYGLIKAGGEAVMVGSQVFTAVPQWLIARYPQASTFYHDQFVPFLQLSLQPRDWQKYQEVVQKWTEATAPFAPYQSTIDACVFTGAGIIAAIVAGVALLLYKAIFTLPFFLAARASCEKEPTVLLLLCAALALGLYWPTMFLVALIVYSIAYCALAAIVPEPPSQQN